MFDCLGWGGRKGQICWNGINPGCLRTCMGVSKMRERQIVTNKTDGRHTYMIMCQCSTSINT